MIDFNPTTKTFNLVLATSYYAFQVDPAVGWCTLAGGLAPPSPPKTI